MNTIYKTLTFFSTLVLFLSGCSQQQVESSSQVANPSQQVAGSSQQQASPAMVDEKCPSCNAPKVEPVPPAPPSRVVAGGHTHPANRCTKSIRHNHPNGSRPHSHKYSCQGVQKSNRWTHSHPANRCTKSIRHTHKFSQRNHHHKYSCQGQSQGNAINIHNLQRKLKAKGYYKGPINGVINPQTRSALKRYQQRRK